MSLRVLASAYACEPGVGSEGGIGWSWARQIAKRHELVLITRRNNVDAIRAAAEQEADLRLRVVGYDLPPNLMRWKRGPRGAMAYFSLWQRGITAVARRLDDESPFDVTHHLTFASNWIGSGLARVDAPFVWGPVGHHDPIPGRFRRPWDVLGRSAEWAKAAARTMLPTLGPLARTTRERANVILSLGGSLPGPLSAAAAARVQPMLACGVDASAPLPRPQRRSGPLRILFAGRLVDLKGPDLALEAFARLQTEQSNATLEFVGDGPRRCELEARARSLGLDRVVAFRGRLPHVDTLSSMSSAHLFLFPSFEGAGMVVVEAMAQGCPVVCLDWGGPGRMVNSRTGIKATSLASRDGAIEDLGRALGVLASDEDLRHGMALGAQAWATDQASWDAKGDQLERIYGEAIEHFQSGRTTKGAA